jgi:hypothetical protein
MAGLKRPGLGWGMWIPQVAYGPMRPFAPQPGGGRFLLLQNLHFHLSGSASCSARKSRACIIPACPFAAPAAHPWPSLPTRRCERGQPDGAWARVSSRFGLFRLLLTRYECKELRRRLTNSRPRSRLAITPSPPPPPPPPPDDPPLDTALTVTDTVATLESASPSFTSYVKLSEPE